MAKSKGTRKLMSMTLALLIASNTAPVFAEKGDYFESVKGIEYKMPTDKEAFLTDLQDKTDGDKFYREVEDGKYVDANEYHQAGVKAFMDALKAAGIDAADPEAVDAYLDIEENLTKVMAAVEDARKAPGDGGGTVKRIGADELKKLKVVSVSAITDLVEGKPGQQLEIGVNAKKEPKTVDELKAEGYEVTFEFTAALPANADERKTGRIDASAAPFNTDFEYRVKVSKDGNTVVSDWKKVKHVASFEDLKEVTEAGLYNGADLVSYMKPGETMKVKPAKALNFKGEEIDDPAGLVPGTVTGATITSDNMAVVFPTGTAFEVRAAAVGTANLTVTFKKATGDVGKMTLAVVVKAKDDALAKVELLKPDVKYALGDQKVVTVLKDVNGTVLRDAINASDVKVSVDGAAVDAADLDVTTAGEMKIPVNFAAAGTKSIVVMDKTGKVELGKFDVTAEDVVETDKPDEYQLSVKAGSLDIKTPANELEIAVKGFKKGVVVDKANFHNDLKVYIDDVELTAPESKFRAGTDGIADIATNEEFDIKLPGAAPFPAVKPDYKLTLKLVEGDRVTLMTPQALDVSVANSTTQITDIKLLKPVTVADMAAVTKQEIVDAAAGAAGELKVITTGADPFAVGMIKEVTYYKDTKVLDIIIEDANGGKHFSLTNGSKHAVAQKIVKADVEPKATGFPVAGGPQPGTPKFEHNAETDPFRVLSFTTNITTPGIDAAQWEQHDVVEYVLSLKAQDGYTFKGYADTDVTMTNLGAGAASSDFTVDAADATKATVKVTYTTP